MNTDVVYNTPSVIGIAAAEMLGVRNADDRRTQKERASEVVRIARQVVNSRGSFSTKTIIRTLWDVLYAATVSVELRRVLGTLLRLIIEIGFNSTDEGSSLWPSLQAEVENFIAAGDVTPVSIVRLILGEVLRQQLSPVILSPRYWSDVLVHHVRWVRIDDWRKYGSIGGQWLLGRMPVEFRQQITANNPGIWELFEIFDLFRALGIDYSTALQDPGPYTWNLTFDQDRDAILWRLMHRRVPRVD